MSSSLALKLREPIETPNFQDRFSRLNAVHLHENPGGLNPASCYRRLWESRGLCPKHDTVDGQNPA